MFIGLTQNKWTSDESSRDVIKQGVELFFMSKWSAVYYWGKNYPISRASQIRTKSVRFSPESVCDLLRNHCAICSGIAVRFEADLQG